jgi:ECF transporter S component (folate family)
MNLKKLITLAFLVAISVLLGRIFDLRIPVTGVETLRLGLGALPIMLAGLSFGPFYGALAGGVADLIGIWLFPQGPFFPHFTLTSMLNGLLPPLLVRPPYKFISVFWAVAVTRICVHSLLLSYFLAYLFHLHFLLIMLPNLFGQIIFIPVFAYLLYKLLKLEQVWTTPKP